MGSELPFAIPPDWGGTTVGAICAAGGGDVQTGPFGSQLHARDYVEDGIPMVMPQDLRSGRIDQSAVARISERDRDRLNRYALADGDIVYSRRGDLRRRAFVTADEAGWLCGTGCLRIRPGHGCDQRYLFHALGHPGIQEWIERHAVGATMPNLNTAILQSCPIPSPPADEQAAIAALLTALDDKIESQRRLADALAGVTLRDGERWIEASGDRDRVVLSDLAEQVKVAGDGDRPYVGLDLMRRGSTVLDSWQTENAPTGASWAFEPQDVLFGKLRPYFRKVAVAPIAGRCTREIVVLRARRSELFGLLISVTASQPFIDHCVAVSSGTRMPRAEWREAGRFRIGMPDEVELRALNGLATASYRKVAALVHESRTLAAIRDALLPKLISGQIRVPLSRDPEEQVGAAVETLT